MTTRKAAEGTDDSPFQGIAALLHGEDPAVTADEEVRRDLRHGNGPGDVPRPLGVERIDAGHAVSDRELASGQQRSRAILDVRMPRVEVNAQDHEALAVVLLGVNLDATQSDVKDGTTALATARPCTDRHGVTWIYLLDSQRTGNVTTAYGVEESPANFLISRDGRIFAVEQSGDALERSIVRALGGLSGGHSRCSSTTIK